MKTFLFLISLAALGLLAWMATPTMVQAQGPTPTPTPVPASPESPMTTSATYAEMVIRVDDWFDNVENWFDQSEGAFDDLDEALGDVNSVIVSGTITVEEEEYSIDDLADEVGNAMAWALIWRCYINSPLTTWILIFVVWLVVVLLTKFAITVIPYIRAIVQFIWGLIRDLWEAIPFI